MRTDRDIKISKLVADASVIVKWFANESGAVKARELLNKVVEGNVLLYVPELLLYEVANALWKGKRLDKKKSALCLEILWDCGISFEQLDMPLARTAIGFMVQYDLTFYDAVYSALAYTLQIPLLTSDVKDHKKIKEIEVIEL